MKFALLSAMALPAAMLAQQAQPDTSVKVTFGGFVDAYYAWDFGRPPSFDRSFAGGTLFTTQPARHNEFNVNLAFVEARVDGNRIRGRLALQAGTAVQSNYSAESSAGHIAGPSLSQHIQEAVAGVRLTENLWVDGGIFFSHIGMESWISRDNPQLTRSLVADYSPYYSSGVKLTWTASSKVAARLDVINGWQNIAENNSGKGAGVRIDVAPSATTTFSYYNFFSDEVGNRLRTFNGVGGKLMVGHTTVLGEIDVGSQGKSAPDGGSASWYGGMLTTRLQFTPRTAIIGRVERYDDKNQIIVSTGNNGTGAPNGALRANGGSIGVDFAPQARVTWRTELRAFANRTAVFPNGPAGEPRKNGGFVVSALALTF